MGKNSIPAIDAATYAVGYGLTVLVESRQVQVGSARFMGRAGLAMPNSRSRPFARAAGYRRGSRRRLRFRHVPIGHPHELIRIIFA